MSYWKAALFVLAAFSTALAQGGDGAFSCEGRTDFYRHASLVLRPVNDPAEIAKIKVRPMLGFQGFDPAKYQLERVEFYRGKTHVQDGGEMDYSDRLALAVHTISASNESWYELEAVADMSQAMPAESLLNMQKLPQEEAVGDAEAQQPAKKGDEMSDWVTVQPAAPNPQFPVFVLRYSYHETGANAAGTIDNNLLFDLRFGTPKIAAAMQCIEWEGGGVCGAPDTGSAQYDNVKCAWEQSVEDLHCEMTSPFGGGYTARNSSRDFYLLSDKEAPAKWQTAESVRDLSSIVTRLRPRTAAKDETVMVDGLGPATMLARIRDILPDAVVYVFGSPGAGDTFNSHLSLVIVRSGGRRETRAIPKWTLGDDAADEATPPAGFTPIEDPAETDHYSIGELEHRPEFRAFRVVLNSGATPGNPLRQVLYWVGLQRNQDDVIASAVRVASNAQTYGGCGRYRDDATAVSLNLKPNVAEAAVTVQPQQQTIMTEPDHPDECSWSGVLHWKAGAGFRVRKSADLCKVVRKNVTIGSDGTIEAKIAPADDTN